MERLEESESVGWGKAEWQKGWNASTATIIAANIILLTIASDIISANILTSNHPIHISSFLNKTGLEELREP